MRDICGYQQGRVAVLMSLLQNEALATNPAAIVTNMFVQEL